MGFRFFDFRCTKCNRIWEEMIDDREVNPRCCGAVSSRRVSVPNLATMKMGVDAVGCPTAAAKWDKAHGKDSQKHKHNLTDV